MKKLLVLLLILTFVNACLGFALAEETAAAPEPEKHTSGDYEYIILEDGTAEITKFDKWSTEHDEDEISLVIPAELDGYCVTSIGDFAFKWCDSLTSVTIPDGVTNIGANPFKACYNLSDITVSNDHPYLATIDGVLFSKPDKRLVCYPVAFTAKAYTIPNGIQKIGAGAFYGCGSLNSITIPDSVNSIGEFAFYRCFVAESIVTTDDILRFEKSGYSCLIDNMRIDFDNEGNFVGSTVPDEYLGYDLRYESAGVEADVRILHNGQEVQKNTLYSGEFIPVEEHPKLLIRFVGVESESPWTIWDAEDGDKIKFRYELYYDRKLYKSGVQSKGESIDLGPYSFIFENPAKYFVISVGKNVTLYVSRGSYAEQYCKDNSVNYTYSAFLDWLNN